MGLVASGSLEPCRNAAIWLGTNAYQCVPINAYQYDGETVGGGLLGTTPEEQSSADVELAIKQVDKPAAGKGDTALDVRAAVACSSTTSSAVVFLLRFYFQTGRIN